MLREGLRNRNKIRAIVLGHILAQAPDPANYLPDSVYHFYLERLLAVPMYGLVQGRELVKMICRCAFNDSSLTETEAIVIMETCLDPALDNILLEVNFNESW